MQIPRFQIYTQIYIHFSTRSRAPNLLSLSSISNSSYIWSSWSWARVDLDLQPQFKSNPMVRIGIEPGVRLHFPCWRECPALFLHKPSRHKEELPYFGNKISNFSWLALKILEKDPRYLRISSPNANQNCFQSSDILLFEFCKLVLAVKTN